MNRMLGMVPDVQASQATDPSAGRGGLAPEDQGGLSKFMGNVAKGVNMVMSHPLYARAWSGLVSGQAQDPTAGPLALEALKQANTPSLQDELNFYRLRQMQRSEADAEREAGQRDRLRQAIGSGDQRSVEGAYAEAFPQQAADRMLAPPKAPTSRKRPLPDGRVQLEEFSPETGRFVPVGEPGSTPALVDVHTGEGPKLTDVRGLRNDYNTEAARFRTAIEQLPLMRSNAALNTGAGDLGLIVAVAKIRDPNSVVREGEIELVREDSSKFEDLKRAAARLNSGKLLLPEQRERLIDSISTEIRSLSQAELKRRESYGSIAQQYQIDPSFIYGQQGVDEMLRAAGIDQAGPAGQQPGAPAVQAPEGVPKGSTNIGPGLWRTPDGRYLAED